MRHSVKAVLGITMTIATSQALAQITFYEREGFRGRPFMAARTMPNLAREGFNDRASSVIVQRGTWEICDDANFHGRCVILREGNYDSLARFGINDRISSVRPVNGRGRHDNRYDHIYQPEPVPVPAYEYRRRPQERLYEVPVTSVHAVMGPPERRCWVERERVRTDVPNNGNNAAGAVVGGIIGGILGHQVGGGRGKDAATVIGAIAGASAGANAGGETAYGRQYERCRDVDSGRPAYWDVTYVFRGSENRVQMSDAPGRTILVNARGEPRQN